MKRPITGRWAAALFWAVLGLAAPVLYGQAAPPAQQNPPPPPVQVTEKPAAKPPGRLAIGLRLRVLPMRSLSVMGNVRAANTTFINKTPYDWNYNTTSKSSMLGYGPAVEFKISERTTLTGEVLYQRLRYNKTTDTYWGTDDPTTSTDERSHSSVAEQTEARLWDIPVIVHYQAIRTPGALSHLYLAGGASMRTVSKIRTTNNITNSDATTAVNNTAAHASRRNLIGATVGVGFRFVDDYNFKVTPEVRYTRWTGVTFSQDSTRSPRNQLEVGLAITR